MKKLTFVLAFVALFAFMAGPVSAQPIEDTFTADSLLFTPPGPVPDPGGSGYEGLWYYYDEFEWWNEWYYDHPFDWDRKKRITVIVNAPVVVEPLEIVVNWSTPEWSLEGNPPGEPRVPPLPGVPELLYIGRSDPPWVITEPGSYQYTYEIPDYNPEWVSIDVRGLGPFIIDGSIIHECIPDPIPAVSEWGVFVMTLLVLSAGTLVFRRFRAVAA